jgi:hypothetical protein
MRKQCRECRSTTNAEAPYCDACGCVFAEVQPVLLHAASWKGRIIAIAFGAIAFGLLAAVVFKLLQG